MKRYPVTRHQSKPRGLVKIPIPQDFRAVTPRALWSCQAGSKINRPIRV